MNKTYSRIEWENYPSQKTPINEQNLNKVDSGLDEVDNRVITLDNTKATKVEVSTLFKEVEFDEQTGILKFTRKNGAIVTIDTPMEKIALNIYYDPVTEMLALPLIDGTQYEVDLSRLITEYEFQDSDTIAFSVSADGKVSAIVKEGSIQEKHLQPNYLADIKVEVAKAEAAETAAEVSKTAAKASEDAAKLSQTAAKASEDAAATSASGAAASEATATSKAAEAVASAATATQKADEAADSADDAAASTANAAGSATTAATKASEASASAASADTYAKQSQSYAVGGTGTREGEDADNARYYYEQTKRISQSKNGLIPMGTISFAELSNPDNQKEGYFFDISDSFLSDERFKNGSGIFYGAGSNVLYTADGMWDVTAASMVSGVKGDAETEYRQGFVNITKENIGLENVVNERQYSALNPQPSVEGSSGSCTGNSATATRASQDAEGNDIVNTYATKDEVDEIKKSVSSGKAQVASAITAKGVTTAATATFAVMAENISMISSAGNVELVGNPIVQDPGYGNASATASFDVSDGGTYLIVATVGEVNPSSSYDGIDLVEFKSDGEHVGTLINSSRFNAPGINQGSELRKNYYYMATGNQKITIHIKAHTFQLPGQQPYGMVSYAEILAFRIS